MKIFIIIIIIIITIYSYFLFLFFFLGCSLESQGHVRRPYVAVVIWHPYVYTYTKNNRIYKMKKLQPPKSKG